MFLLGKLLLLLLKPLTWILIIFLIGLISKNLKKKKRFILASFVMLLFFSNPFFCRVLVKMYETKPVVLQANENFQAGIVLGGFVSYNDKTGGAYFSEASDRFIETVLLYKTGHISKIIVSGGNGYAIKNAFQEAYFVKDRLVQAGVLPQDILTEGLSRNTYQNAVYTKRICDSMHLTGPFLLISSAIHIPRAEALFKKQQMDVRPYPCDFLAQTLANNFWEDYLIPSSYTLYEWDLFLKEITGLLVYKIIGRA